MDIVLCLSSYPFNKTIVVHLPKHRQRSHRLFPRVKTSRAQLKVTPLGHHLGQETLPCQPLGFLFRGPTVKVAGQLNDVGALPCGRSFCGNVRHLQLLGLSRRNRLGDPTRHDCRQPFSPLNAETETGQ